MTSSLKINGLKILENDLPSSSEAPILFNIGESKEINSNIKFRGRAAIVTLGCAKNHVDSEVMLGALRNQGYDVVNEVEQADIAIVNTCGFLESSIKESIDCILDVAKLKESGRLRRLIVAGCAVERFLGEIDQTMPEVDAFVGLNDILQIGDVAGGGQVAKQLSEAARPYFLYDDTLPRELATRSHTAYVKISEGCDRPCTFCIIPKIRGPLRSRSIESVVREVQALGAKGVKEINLVAQDLTSFGKDLKGGNLNDLLHQLDRVKAVDWIRLLYAYPVGTDQELLRSIVELPSICNYLDIPLQHASERVLKDMKRPIGRYSARPMVEFINKIAPEIQIRTTFIVGFPGETDEDVDQLVELVSAGYFASVGVFTYSREPGTPSYELAGQLPEEEKSARRERVMLAQQLVVEGRLSNYKGKKIDVLIEGTHEESDMLLVGRANFQAPEVDGTVIINEAVGDFDSDKSLLNLVGSIHPVEVSEIAGYDLVGKVIIR